MHEMGPKLNIKLVTSTKDNGKLEDMDAERVYDYNQTYITFLDTKWKIGIASIHWPPKNMYGSCGLAMALF